LRRVFDTSAWIEKLVGSELGLKLNHELPPPEDCIVPTIVQLELAKWLARECPAEVAAATIAYTLSCLVVPLDSEIALRAARLCKECGLATADAIIYATAQAADAELVTCDAHFAGLPRVRYFEKT
jgi:predicted nucleic acid-binding protein